jgi:hypothetical protein
MNPILARNIQALEAADPALSSRISEAAPSPEVSFIRSKSGHPVPLLRKGERTYPLHSTVDPLEAGSRAHAGQKKAGYLVFFGLGAGYGIIPLLREPSVGCITIVETDISIMRSILEGVDLSPIFRDGRVRILVDPKEGELRAFVRDTWLASLVGDLRTIPLRSRTVMARERFSSAALEIEQAAEEIRYDYSVQARFAKRWMSHTLTNLPFVERPSHRLSPYRRVLVVGAGPSLDLQLSHLLDIREGSLLISVDSALPALVRRGIRPDLALFLDCQQWGYHHVLSSGRAGAGVPLLLELSVPPVLSRSTRFQSFFAGGHPLSRYLSNRWIRIPCLDTSGGNVSHTAVSLAGVLGAEEVFLYGMDFSYPDGAPYTRGTYLSAIFESRSSRITPVETSFFSMMFKSDVSKVRTNGGILTTTPLLLDYKRRLEALISGMDATVTSVKGKGLPIRGRIPPSRSGREAAGWREQQPPRVAHLDFLREYMGGLESLPRLTEPVHAYLASLHPEQKEILATVLPLVPCIERETGQSRDRAALLESARNWSICRLKRVLSARGSRIR